MITVIETPTYRVTLTSGITATTLVQSGSVTLMGHPGPQGPAGPVGPDGSAALTAAIGNTDRDFAADYTTAKA